MQISSINSLKFHKNYTSQKISSNTSNVIARNTAPYTAQNAKAVFMPSFQAFRKVGQAVINKRDTGTPVIANIKKETFGDCICLKLMVGRKEAGFLDMQLDSVFPEQNSILTLPTNRIPEIRHIRTILGDEYEGVGTALIKTAIQESYNNGGFGNLWLTTEKGYARTYAAYRSNENPIPFYYKVGFASPKKDMDIFIRKCIDNANYDKLPDSTLLLLTPESREKWLGELINKPLIKFKTQPITA